MPPPRRFAPPLVGLPIALLAVAAWSFLHEAPPLLQTGDLFTHLSVARHLLRGDGFLTDITYPLSFAFDFARTLPQPLIHRGPGFSLLLTLPVSLSHGDPAAAVHLARLLQLVFLMVITWIGATEFIRRRWWSALAAWPVILLSSHLFGFAVDWVFVELPVALGLLLLWLRRREVPVRGPGPLDGLLAGLVVLLRWDLVWVPVLWWTWDYLERGQPAKRLMTALAWILLVNLPWLGRNFVLSGNPFFTLQSQAEMVKDTRIWPGYSVYQQLEPQPLARVLARDPGPLLRKFVRGLDFYFQDLDKFLPWIGLIIMALALVVYLRGRVDQRPCLLRPDAREPMSIRPEVSPLGPLVVAAGTLLGLVFQYSFFDHSLRHLLVLYPVLVWEFSFLIGLGLTRLAAGRHLHPWLTPLAAMLVAGLLIRITAQPMPGWDFAARQARTQQKSLAARTLELVNDPARVPFVRCSDTPWYARRAAVWDPEKENIRQEIRALLAQQPSALPPAP